MNRFSRSLSLKLIAGLIGSLIVIYALLAYQVTRLHRQSLEELNLTAAQRISDSIKSSIFYSMSLNHRDEVYQAIKTVGQEPGINRVRIYNEVGVISFSSDESEIGKMVDKNAEACYVCHGQEQPLRHLESTESNRIFEDKDGNRILGRITAIHNAPPCYNADCHAHSASQNVLGVLDVTLSLAEMDRAIVRGETHLVLNMFVGTLILAGILAFLIWRMVYQPVRLLLTGTQRVAEGDLSFQIPVESSDEMGVLGHSFNEMTRQLKGAQDELHAWTQTLETRVQETTQKLNHAHQQILRVERMASMGKLAAIVAHEINNPLAGVLTSARLLLRKLVKLPPESSELSSQLHEHLELIATETARCGDIVKNLLQFTRQAAKELKPNDINTLIDESLRLVRHKIHLMNIETRLELGERIPPVVCDAQLIRQAVVAMLINACEAVPESGGIIEVGSARLAGQNSVSIWIHDNGCGMDNETQQRVFEPFFTTKEEGKGVGLGLSVVSGIVSSHGGEIEVASTVGAGTTFTITLPLSIDGKMELDYELARAGSESVSGMTDEQ